MKKDPNDISVFNNLREVNTVGTLAFKLLSGSFLLGIFSAFFFLVDNKTKTLYFPPAMETVKPLEEAAH